MPFSARLKSFLILGILLSLQVLVDQITPWKNQGDRAFLNCTPQGGFSRFLPPILLKPFQIKPCSVKYPVASAPVPASLTRTTEGCLPAQDARRLQDGRHGRAWTARGAETSGET